MSENNDKDQQADAWFVAVVIGVAIALIILCGCSAIGGERQVNWVKLVDAIAQVENGTPSGKGGVLCWTRVAWEEETNLDYGYSVDYSISRTLAISRLARQSRTNNRHSIEEIASLWRYGPEGRRTSDYGRRVANLYSQ